MTTPADLGEQLRALGDSIRDAFVKNRRVMSYAEYLQLVEQKPLLQLRSAEQYLRDTFDHFGSEQVEYPWGKVRRFKLFDCPWADGRDRLIGQEEVQNKIYRALSNFVNEGAANRLVLMHGPNGSAKSTLVQCMGRALQHYSALDEGALYRINWIFPGQKVSKSGIGFSGAGYDAAAHGDTFAYLPDEMIDAKLVDELRDHPLFLLPGDRRRAMMAELLGAHPEAASFVLSDYLQYGQLSHKNRAIYEALLTSYQGDYLKVLRHVQVERFYIQHRYRTGFVTVEPQLAIDAVERQITADRSVAALPSALQSVVLFEYGGELVGANRGLIEYSDLLKRPLEAYKYLLTTVERSTVALSSAILFLDIVYIGTSNEVHLSLFKEIAEFQSFKGRLELIRVPYLLDYLQEQKIYEQKLREAASNRHIAPHCAYVVALWAVLTRMRKPLAERYPKEVADLVARLTPLDKAELYASGRTPDNFNPEQSRELRARLGDLWRESDAYPNYEGRTGASPREIQTVLLNAANSPQYGYVSPLAIFDELDDLVKNVTVYEFLKQEALPGGYHENKKFIHLARERWLDRVDEEVRDSLGLVEETEYVKWFERYVSHVMYWTKNEKVRNPTTGRVEDPDEEMMREVERTIEVKGRGDDFRNRLIARIGAWSLDHPNEKPDYARIFPDYFKKLRAAYFEQQRKVVKRGVEELAAFLTQGARSLDEAAKRRAKDSLDTLINRYGYIEASARDAVTVLARARYA
jgi:predicted Ser/Thr protein kinase